MTSNSEQKTVDSPTNKIDSDDKPNVVNKHNSFTSYAWPITKSELPKFLLITLLMFSILGVQNLIRAMKDSIINTMIGTETISFLKFWGVLPAAFLVTLIYVKLVSVMKGENIFYLVMSSFIGFFLLFAFYIFPNHETMHLNKETIQYLITSYPNFKWFILLLSNWSFSLFYIIAELWPNLVFALLFWQFVNKITTIDESKRFYPLFGLLGQTGLYLSGVFLKNLGLINIYFKDLYNLEIPKEALSLQIVITVTSILGVMAIISFWLINNYILDIATTEKLEFRIKKNKITVKESIKMVIESRYIRLITIMLLCYGFSINLVEGPWKSEASKIYRSNTEFTEFMGSYMIYTGILTVTFVILGSNIVRILGWMSAAIITPIMMLITGLLFFVVLKFDSTAVFFMGYFALTDPLMVVILIGAIQNVMSKSTKYTLFDSTKEMSYVPLQDQLKTRGKAAADMLGTKMGKSSSAFLQSIFFIIIPSATFSSISGVLMCIFVIVCAVWIWTVIELNKEYKLACMDKTDESIY